MKRQTGFSLVELLIVLAVAAIIAAIAVPSMIGLINGSRVSSTAEVLTNDLVAARLDAIRYRRQYTVCAVTNPDTATTCSNNANGWGNGWIVLNRATGAVVSRHTANKGLTMVGAVAPPGLASAASGVTFSGVLGGTDNTVTLCFSKGTEIRRVIVLTTGRVTRSTGGAAC
ncbi:GspH/FimT family pseudopilin [Leeia aquatica]|uniref:Type II secretion system protein H n=1 Tax=Leeia aquatica TaxID=2725557 RepID=A0A847S4J1_9NEIS|nr:GspH/FimT family pseudopilin [Leeia aquatica]NLR74713.1 prepilin-type N-terminal cleavage/methylation domain-containing protein [Leeia aquatica]